MTGPDAKLTATVLPISKDSIDAAIATLEALHFDVQRVIGGSLVISATQNVFSDVFGHEVTVDDKQRASFIVEGSAMSELSQPRLPTILADKCLAVELHQPLDFGPGSFG